MISDEGLCSKKQHLCVKRMKLILSELQTHRWTVSSGMLLLEYLLPAVIVSEVVPLFTLRKTNFLMHWKNAMIIFTHFKHERSCWRPFFFFFSWHTYLENRQRLFACFFKIVPRAAANSSVHGGELKSQHLSNNIKPLDLCTHTHSVTVPHPDWPLPPLYTPLLWLHDVWGQVWPCVLAGDKLPSSTV